MNYEKILKTELIELLKKRDNAITTVVQDVYDNTCEESHEYIKQLLDLAGMPGFKVQKEMTIHAMIPIDADPNDFDRAYQGANAHIVVDGQECEIKYSCEE